MLRIDFPVYSPESKYSCEIQSALIEATSKNDPIIVVTNAIVPMMFWNWTMLKSVAPDSVLFRLFST